jgi:hypothetical protein
LLAIPKLATAFQRKGGGGLEALSRAQAAQAVIHSLIDHSQFEGFDLSGQATASAELTKKAGSQARLYRHTRHKGRGDRLLTTNDAGAGNIAVDDDVTAPQGISLSIQAKLTIGIDCTGQAQRFALETKRRITTSLHIFVQSLRHQACALHQIAGLVGATPAAQAFLESDKSDHQEQADQTQSQEHFSHGKTFFLHMSISVSKVSCCCPQNTCTVT